MDLQPMAIAPRAPGDYAPAAGARAVETLQAAAEPLAGARVLHVSAAGADGRVPELLGGSLPLAAGAGLEVHWRVLLGAPELRATMAALRSGLRGAQSAIDDEEWESFIEAAARVGRGLEGYDAVVLHDSALGLAAGIEGRAVWHCHDDASRAEPEALARAAALTARCAQVLVPHASFAPEGLAGSTVTAVAPGIDPLGPRNIELESRLPGRVLRPLGIDLERPFCLQVLAVDGFDDPQPVIEALRLAHAEEPDLQLVLAALLETADSAGWQAAKEISDDASNGAGVLLVTTYQGLGSRELGALQLLARAVLGRSRAEAFDLAPCEALWKRTPVIGPPEGGLPLIVRDGVEGYLSAGVEESARRMVELVRDPGLAAEMGRAGRERVRERFLVTAALERELVALAGTVQAA